MPLSYAATVNVVMLGAASALPAKSFTPVVTMAVYTAAAVSAAVGLNVTILAVLS